MTVPYSSAFSSAFGDGSGSTPAPSASGYVLNYAGQTPPIYNTIGQAFALISATTNFAITVDGVTDTSLSNITQLLYYGNLVYAQVNGGVWYNKSIAANSWAGPGADPRPSTLTSVIADSIARLEWTAAMPTQAGVVVNPIEWKTTIPVSSKVTVVPLEWSKILPTQGGMITAPIQWTSSQIIALNGPADWRSQPVRDITIPTELSRYTSVSSTFPIEQTNGISVDKAAPIDSQQIIGADSNTATTWNIGFTQQGATLPAEWTTGLVGGISIPIEANIRAGRDIGGIYEIAQQNSQFLFGLTEWRSVASMQSVFPADASSLVYPPPDSSTGAFPGYSIEWIQATLADATFPAASGITVARGDAVFPEWSGGTGVSGVATVPLEWSALYRSADGSQSIDWANKISADNAATSELLRMVVFTQAIASDRLNLMISEANSEIAWNIGILQNITFPPEWTGGVGLFGDAVMPLVWNGGIQRTEQPCVEIQSGMAYSVVAPLYTLATPLYDLISQTAWNATALAILPGATEWGGISFVIDLAVIAEWSRTIAAEAIGMQDATQDTAGISGDSAIGFEFSELRLADIPVVFNWGTASSIKKRAEGSTLTPPGGDAE